MGNIKLTPFERRSLINQCRIMIELQKLGGNSADAIASLKQEIAVLTCGYTSLYGSEGKILEDELPEEVQETVWRILDMYRDLQHSAGINGLDESDYQFQGWDLNDANCPWGFMCYLLKHNKLIFSDILFNENLNSGDCTSFELDCKRLALWKSITEDGERNCELSVGEINKIWSAA